jgi:hypothetical protein|tara:strand:- start:334 stop:513 length:180 start_codon:yes stop_codon:yes gene_type:complete
MIKKIKANILTYLFQDWLDNDADIEGLQATRNIINNREDALSKVGNSGRVIIKGFKTKR